MYRAIVRAVPSPVKSAIPRSLKARVLTLAYRVTHNPAIGVASVRHLVRQGNGTEARRLIELIGAQLKANKGILLNNKQPLQFQLEEELTHLDQSVSMDPLVNTQIINGSDKAHIGDYTVTKKFLGIYISGFVDTDLLPIKSQSWKDLKVRLRINGKTVRQQGLLNKSGKIYFSYNIKRPALTELPYKLLLEVEIVEIGKLNCGGSDFVTILNELGRREKGDSKLPVTLNKKGLVAEGAGEVNEVQNSFLEIYKSVNEVFEQVTGRPLFLLYGSLLGLYRDGDFIPGDDDFDIGYLSNESDPIAVKQEAKKIIEKLVEAGFTIVINRRGKPFRIKDTRVSQDLHLDARPVWFQNGKFWAHKKACLDLNREDFEDCKLMGFRGYQVYVPKGTVEFLRAYYGENWRQPDPNFSNNSVTISNDIANNLGRCSFSIKELNTMQEKLKSKRGAGDFVAISLQDLYPLASYGAKSGW